MAKSNSLHDSQHLTNSLLKRFEVEIGKGNYREANLVGHNFLWLYPGEERAKRILEETYIAKAEGLLHENNLKEAQKAIKSALQLEEANPRYFLTLVKIERKLETDEHYRSTKVMARKFVETNFPEELPILNLAWRVFRHVQPKDFPQHPIPAALQIAGKQPSELKTPKIVVFFNKLASEDMEALTHEQLKKLITKIGRDAGCPQKLIGQLTNFILKTE